MLLLVYGIEGVKKDESDEGGAIADGADAIDNKTQNKNSTNHRNSEGE